MSTPTARFPASRPRRLRSHPWIRSLVRETSLAPSDFLWPVFLVDGENIRQPIGSMPGVERLSVDLALPAIAEAHSLGIPAVALFPYVEEHLRTEDAREAWNPDNLVCRATRRIKAEIPGIGVMQDVALDPYNSLGHDGLVSASGEILNDESVEALVRQALCQAEAGTDIIGPSDMMDGRISSIRTALEDSGYTDTIILSYAAKYASVLYGPFRDATGSGTRLKGDKRTYQMDEANTNEALREVAMDIAEGADMVMVKPGAFYLDVCWRVKEAFGVPTFAYQVSGEYAMIRTAADSGCIDGRAAILESLRAFRRAGCDGILTYFAVEAAQLLRDSPEERLRDQLRRHVVLPYSDGP